MKVSVLIEALRALPQDAEVLHLWDGEPRTEINHVWLARGGQVITADHGMVCYSTESRPVDAPDSKHDPYWETPRNPMDDLDPKGNPARVLAAICKARGEPLDDDVVESLAAYCDELVPVPDDVALAECARRQMTNEECGMWQARKKRCPDCPLGE